MRQGFRKDAIDFCILEVDALSKRLLPCLVIDLFPELKPPEATYALF